MEVENKPARPTTPIVKPTGSIDDSRSLRSHTSQVFGIQVPNEAKSGGGCAQTTICDIAFCVAMHKVDEGKAVQRRGEIVT